MSAPTEVPPPDAFQLVDLKNVTYPTAWVRLQLKLENIGRTNPISLAAEEAAAAVLSPPTIDTGNPLQDAADEAARAFAAPGTAVDDLILLQYVPLSATVVKNSFREADTFEVKIDFEDFPMDPRIIEGATVTIYMADAESLDVEFWQRTGDLRPFAQIAGVVDKVKTGLGGEGRITELKGRDYTAYFLDIPAEATPIAFTTPGGRKLTFVEVLESIIKKRPLTEQITIRNRDEIDDLFPADYKLTKRKATGATTATRKKKQGEVIWEVMTEIALEAGHIIYIDLDELVVRKPRQLFVEDVSDKPTDWFRWTLGQDIHGLDVERRMGRQQGINVRCISYQDDDKKVLVANFPVDPLQAAKVQIPATPEGQASPGTTMTIPNVTFRPFVFRGITSQKQLEFIAEQVYRLVQHHELEGSFSTGEFFDSEGRSIWPIRYGDPVTFDVADSLRSIISLDQAEQIKALVEDTGLEESAATAIAQAMTATAVPFYFHTITMRFDSMEGAPGFTMDAEFRSRKLVDTSAVIAASEKSLGVRRLGSESVEAT